MPLGHLPSYALRKARWILGLALLAPALAAGQTAVPGFNLERLELNPSAVGSLVLDTPRLLPMGGFRFSAVPHYERDPLLVISDNTLVGPVVQDRFTVHVTGDYAIRDWFELGLQVPVVATQTSGDLTQVGLAPPAASGLGTPVVTARLGLLSMLGAGVIHPHEKDPVDVAVQVGLGLPVGSPAALARDPSLAVQPKLLLGRQVGEYIVAGEISGLLRQAQVLAAEEIGNQLNFGASVSRMWQRFGGEITLRSAVPLTHAATAFEVLLGLRYRFSPFLEGFAAGGFGVGTLPGIPAFRALLGVAYGSGEEPKKPAAVTPPPVVYNPCVPGEPHKPNQCPALDDDEDGVPNGQDQCPLDKGTAERQGCPEPDMDLDGTPDAVDQCPNEPGPQGNHGCPVGDRDHDNIPDNLDSCPDEPGVPEAHGCPVKDSDNDTVPDYQDNCPNEPGPVSNQGCPEKEKQLVQITREKLEIKEKIFFAFDKAEVLPVSFNLLNQIAKILQEHKEIAAVSIEGHTDNVGTAAYNQRLSQARAEAVRAYLIKQGVEPDRLVAKGFGFSRPLATNTTDEGREQNRRVEFHILESRPEDGAAQPAPSPAPGGVQP